MVTVQSVNHAAADVSSPFLFPFFSLLHSQPPACTQPLPFFSSPVVHSCVPSLHLILFFPSNLKNPLPWLTLSPLPHFLPPHPCHPLTSANVLISRDRKEGVGWRRHNVHLTFNQRLSQHAVLLVGEHYEHFHELSFGRILQYLQHP